MTTVPQFTLNWGVFARSDRPDHPLGRNAVLRQARWKSFPYPRRNRQGGQRRGARENIETASFMSSMDERFSDYVGVSMSMTPAMELSPDSGYSAVTLARAQDPEVAKMRYRNRIVIVESTMNSHGQAQNCIDWEMNRRYGRSRRLQVEIDSWRDKAGKLWEPNTLIPINIPVLGSITCSGFWRRSPLPVTSGARGPISS